MEIGNSLFADFFTGVHSTSYSYVCMLCTEHYEMETADYEL